MATDDIRMLGKPIFMTKWKGTQIFAQNGMDSKLC